MRVLTVCLAVFVGGIAPAAAQDTHRSSVVIGVALELGGEDTRHFRDSFATFISENAAGRRLAVVDGCDEVTFCLTVVGVPVLMGEKERGKAIAGYVSRRLVSDLQWPWQPKNGASASTAVITIEDAYTARGGEACVECQEELEGLQRQVEAASAAVAATLVDEGDLQIAVGPADASFVSATARSMAQAVIGNHVDPWLDRGLR